MGALLYLQHFKAEKKKHDPVCEHRAEVEGSNGGAMPRK